MTPTTFTNIEAADAAIMVFDHMATSVDAFDKLQRIYGGPFDIRQYTPDKYTRSTQRGFRESYCLNLNREFNIEVIKNESMDVTIRKVYLYYNSTFLGMFSHLTPKAGFTIAKQDATSYIAECFWNLKKMAGVTIREHQRYLASPTFYDTIQNELDIKPFKPRKRK